MTLTPQMKQALGLLQAPVQTLRELIRQEVDVNPVLELEDPSERSIDAEREDYSAAPSEERDFDEDSDAVAGPGPGESPDGEAPSSPAETEGLAALGADADYLYSDGGNNEYDPDAEERRQFLFDSIPARESLQEHLMLQLAEAGLPEAETQLCEQIVGSVDSSGYLRTPLEEIAQGSFATMPQAERALAVVQGFTPAGVAARDLRECLLLQLRADPSPATRPAERLLASQEAFEDLAARRFARAASRAGVTEEQAEEALRAIARLDPRPGRQFSSEPADYVRPEVEFRPVAGRWTAFLLDDDLPRVRVSDSWRARAARLEEAPKGETPAASKERRAARRWIEERLRSGEQLLHGIAQRQATLLAVAQAIADAQPDYFERGRAGLRPLTMAQVAEKVGIHETTVSRAVGGKYARSPQGVAELRSFFVGGLATPGGDETSTDAVKARLKAMVDAEDPSAPLSDQKIADLFAASGVKLARRTVAKYRDELRIPVASDRKFRP